MKINIFQIDAFTDQVFSGNPAAVCPLDEWLPDETLQKIAFENNLSETAFYIRVGNKFHIRWFTPAVEVDLCGHATLATAYVLFEIYNIQSNTIEFNSKSGELIVTNRAGLIELNFPVSVISSCDTPEEITKGFGKKPSEVLKCEDYIAVFENEEEVKSLQPDLNILSQLECRGVLVTAKGDNTDFVSRFFAPRCGISEDPVTGSAHCSLTPYWAAKLGKNKLTAIQLSARGGKLNCELEGSRVKISGKAVKYLEGTIEI